MCAKLMDGIVSPGERRMLVAPALCGVESLNVYVGLNVLVLDELLMEGFAGVYFRRLQLQASVYPGMRAEYENKRTAYLRVALMELNMPVGCVVVGTRASDVDLVDCETVYALRVADRALRGMSKSVYGDPVMMCMDYASTTAGVGNAVDEWLDVTDWVGVPMLLKRRLGVGERVECSLSESRQRSILTELLVGQSDAHVWLEDSLLQAVRFENVSFTTDYDYLGAVRSPWRDAVVRTLGKAPAVADVFRLPWYVVDGKNLQNLCCRNGLHGRPLVSATGRSLVAFVREHLTGVMSTREVVGSWIGGILCDDVTAMDTVIALGDEVLLPVDDVDASKSQVSDELMQFVPSEYAWMYAAINGVCVKHWNGERRIDGQPVFGDDLGRWANTLPFAQLYADVVPGSEMGTAVVQFLWRLHTAMLSPQFLHRLYVHAVGVGTYEECTFVFAREWTCFLPGYTYLTCFRSDVRSLVVRVYGCLPQMSDVALYANDKGMRGTVYTEQLAADVARSRVYTGDRTDLASLRRVESVLASHAEQGYCYLCMFKPVFRARARKRCGAYPTLRRLLVGCPSRWYEREYERRVYVTFGTRVRVGNQLENVLHFSVDPIGMTLHDFRKAMQYSRFGKRHFDLDWRVGQAGVCYSSQWYVSAIIAWTIVGVCVLAVLVWLLYIRFSGGRRSRGYGR